MSEEWRDIKGFEELYQVSSMGRIKSLERKDCLGRTIRERILKPRTDRYGYLFVDLCNGSGKPKAFKVHRLVCQAFHENLDNKPQVNHLNEDKKDNRACNLEWCTCKVTSVKPHEASLKYLMGSSGDTSKEWKTNLRRNIVNDFCKRVF